MEKKLKKVKSIVKKIEAIKRDVYALESKFGKDSEQLVKWTFVNTGFIHVYQIKIIVKIIKSDIKGEFKKIKKIL